MLIGSENCLLIRSCRKFLFLPMHLTVEGATSSSIASKSFDFIAAATLRANSCWAGVGFQRHLWRRGRRRLSRMRRSARRAHRPRRFLRCGGLPGKRGRGQRDGQHRQNRFRSQRLQHLTPSGAGTTVPLSTADKFLRIAERLQAVRESDGEISLCRGWTSIARAMRSLRCPRARASRRAATAIRPTQPWARSEYNCA